MKSKKVLKHNDLMTEVIKHLRFPCEIDHINQRVKQLIQMDYMKHDEKDSKLYHYVA